MNKSSPLSGKKVPTVVMPTLAKVGATPFPTDKVWDVIVIGGGPAGMMAAGTAAENGASVLLLERNESLGKKLLITGGGRCNVTNAEEEVRVFLSKFNARADSKGVKNSEFLFSAFSQWAVKESLDFFHSRGMPTKVEAEKRVFPTTEQARSVWNVLVERLASTGVVVRTNAPVSGFFQENDSLPEKIAGVTLTNGEQITGRTIILATGGLSRPETGSTGDGFKWLKEIGHTVQEGEAALVPITVKDAWISKLAGVTVPLVKITILQNGVKNSTKKGKILFMHVGASGPTILNMSTEIGELLKYGDVELAVDLLPDEGHEKANAKLQEVLKSHSNKKIKNSLSGIIPTALAHVIIELAQINPDTFCHSITREERLVLIQLLKGFPLKVKGLLGFDKAVVTSGGVALSEVDFRTMQSRLFPNLYLIGDILDIDRPSGGYSLQLCWTTGAVAGKKSAKASRSV